MAATSPAALNASATPNPNTQLSGHSNQLQPTHLSCSACSIARCLCSRSWALLAMVSTLRVAARPLRGDAPCGKEVVN